jgi:hypothetical protein
MRTIGSEAFTELKKADVSAMDGLNVNVRHERFFLGKPAKRQKEFQADTDTL